LNFLFAWRYFKAKKSTNAINVISWISIVAIVVGTTSLILVLSVFNGFEGLVKSLYSSFYPDLKVIPETGKQIVLTEAQLQKLRSIKGVKDISLVVEERALLQFRVPPVREGEDTIETQSVVYIKGVDDNYSNVTGIAKGVVYGRYNVGDVEDPRVLLGYGIGSSLNIQNSTDDRLLIYLPRKGDIDVSNPIQSLSTGTAYSSGMFAIQQDFDNKYAITNLSFLKQMLGMEQDAYGGAEIALQPDTDLENIQQQMQGLLGKGYVVQTRYEQNMSLYSVMQIEKWFIYGILSLILVVAAFNMIGALTMLVLEKKQDISVLHALGADRSFIQRIFLTEGLLLALIGGGTGMLLAFIIGWLQTEFHLIPLEGNSFLIDYFPVKMIFTDFLLVAATVLVIAFIAAWFPSRKAAKQQFILRSE